MNKFSLLVLFIFSFSSFSLSIEAKAEKVYIGCFIESGKERKLQPEEILSLGEVEKDRYGEYRIPYFLNILQNGEVKNTIDGEFTISRRKIFDYRLKSSTLKLSNEGIARVLAVDIKEDSIVSFKERCQKKSGFIIEHPLF